MAGQLRSLNLIKRALPCLSGAASRPLRAPNRGPIFIMNRSNASFSGDSNRGQGSRLSIGVKYGAAAGVAAAASKRGDANDGSASVSTIGKVAAEEAAGNQVEDVQAEEQAAPGATNMITSEAYLSPGSMRRGESFVADLQLSKTLLLLAVPPALLAYTLSKTAPFPVVFALGYTAATTLAVAVACSNTFAESTTWLFGKGKDGTFPWWSWAVWWPYHLGLRAKLSLTRSILFTEPLYNKIVPGWYLGGWPWSADKVPPGNVSVVDVTCELPKKHNNKYLNLPTWDTQVVTIKNLDKGVDWALNEYSNGRPVYIHCAHGHGRSATVLAACLIEVGIAATTDEAIKIMQAARPRVALSTRQIAVLDQWYAQRHLSEKVRQAEIV